MSELMIGLSSGLGLLCLIVVSARLYTRAILLRNAGLDDVFILFTEVGGFWPFDGPPEAIFVSVHDS